jgi:hypothetical protein
MHVPMVRRCAVKDQTAKHRVSGQVAPGFERVRIEFERNLSDRRELGGAVAAYWHGDKVVATRSIARSTQPRPLVLREPLAADRPRRLRPLPGLALLAMFPWIAMAEPAHAAILVATGLAAVHAAPIVIVCSP